MCDTDLMPEFDGGCENDLAYALIFDLPAKKEPDLQKLLLRTDKEITGLAREHDRSMRGVDPLIAKLSRCFPQSLPGIDQVFGKITREVFFRRRPAIVRRTFFNLLLAVIALSGCHRPSEPD